MATNLASKEELTKEFLATASPEFDRFKTDRENVGQDDMMQVADAMWRCMQDRSMRDTEQNAAKGISSDDQASYEPEANMSSVRFWRFVNQKAAMGVALTVAADPPFKYAPIANPNIFRSAQDGNDQAAIHNALARYTWKKSGSKMKMYEFWNQAYKYSNLFWTIKWVANKKRIKHFDIADGKYKWGDVLTSAHPTWELIPWSMIYADLYAGGIQNQKCVIVLSIVSWMDIMQGVKNKWYDADQIEKLRKERVKYRWDGNYGSEFREGQVTNAGGSDLAPGESELYLMWDIYQYSPIENGEWDKEAMEYKLYWMSAIGNSLDANGCIPLRLETDFDPDGEIPIYDVHSMPDDSNLLYHMPWSQTVRAMYSVECAAWSMMIDNNRAVTNPMMAYDSTKMSIVPTDFRFRKGGSVDCVNPRDTIVAIAPPSTLGENVQLLKLLQEEQGIAANINRNMVGEEFGKRTPATEGMNINNASQQASVGEARYVLDQFLPKLASKQARYWQTYGDPAMIEMIADEHLDGPVYVDSATGNEKMPPGIPIYGDFDIEVTVIDEFVDDFIKAGQEIGLLQTVASNPQLQSSPTHRIDMGEWLKSIFRRLKVANVDDVIQPAKGSDAQLRQRDEIRSMMESGTYVEPQQGEDHQAHIGELESFKRKWNPILKATRDGLEVTDQQELGRMDLIVQQFIQPHIDAHTAMMAQEASAQQAQAPQRIPGEAGNMTPGQELGVGVSAAFGQAGRGGAQ